MNSIIGVTGMQGNAWYGFSNDVLDLILRRFNIRHHDTHIISIAYSIWGEEGMGLRMGSVDLLRHQGIEAIPSEEGVKRFTRLCLKDAGTPLVVVSARLGGMDTFNIPLQPGPLSARYLETPQYVVPGVESVFHAHLTMESDPYLKDHDFNGSYLFPTVFGLEAMAQTVAHTLGLKKIDRVRIENLKLQLPITVDPKEGADIVVRALALEKDEEDASTQRKVCAWISVAGAGEGEYCFSAEFILNLTDKAPELLIEKSQMSLSIQPLLDLYREGMMFQGPRFQRIQKIWQMDADGNEANRAVFETYTASAEKTCTDAFGVSKNTLLLLGDPFFRDTLLQSAQMLIPQEMSLPIYIGRWDIYPQAEEALADVLAVVELSGRRDNELDFVVTAVDSLGRIREKIEDYTLRILKHQPYNPSVLELLNPDERDAGKIRQIITEAGDALGFETPEMAMRYLPDMHSLAKEERRAAERPLIQEVLKKVLKSDIDIKEPYEIQWLDSGKPVLPRLIAQNIDVSLSHDERLCICCAGKGVQGIDIAPIMSRNRSQWMALLDARYTALLELLEKDKDSLDAAGTRLWAALEALRKMGETEAGAVSVENRIKDAVLFKAGTASRPVWIFTVPALLTWGPPRMIALVVRPKTAAFSESPPVPGFEDLRGESYIKMLTGPQGQTSIAIRIPVTFRANAQLSRTVYFSNYMFWAGDARETAIWPILRQVGEQFATGKWGSVTNNSRLRILGEATAQDQIEIRIWVDDNHGRANSTMDLKFDFLKVLSKDQYERLAWCEQSVTWVRILDHGIVTAEPYPKYYEMFMQKMLPQNDNPTTLPPYPESLQSFYKEDQTAYIYTAPPGPDIKPLLHKQIIETSLDHSNLVGNIYFANYYLWQGTVRDRYFYSIIPEYYRGAGQNGELICLESRINHLREAMPFDRIIVTIALKSLKPCKATFYFEYFRQEPDNRRTKLAYGEQDAVWVMRDNNRLPYEVPFPVKLIEVFKRACEVSR